VIDFLVKTRPSKAVSVKVILGLFARRLLKTYSGDFTRRITNALASDSTRRASRRTDHSRRAQSDGLRVGQAPVRARRRLGAKPNGDRAISAYVQAALSINGMQPAAHVLDPGAEAGEHIRLEIDVPELDLASPGGPDEPAVLPLNASITDGALGVVPDSERRTHF